ncbi:MAG: methyltransferase domain-containing protein [Anaerolineaceae bacterium]|nr:methyltransferase domain-containing protein [Anaerolineaceae bacterium]MCB9101222.1 methyltransferase domain-containing protein [Anaerolineales bacterium]
MQKVASIFEIIRGVTSVQGKTVVDVGSGAGSLARWCARQGARTVGVEYFSRPLVKSKERPPEAGLQYIQAQGELLPLGRDFADIVIFAFSLHHIPIPFMFKALSEAQRILKPKGLLLVLEPLAEGSGFELLRIIEDETEIRRYAYEALYQAEQVGLTPVAEKFFVIEHLYADEEKMVQSFIDVDVRRQEKLNTLKREFKERFYELGVPSDEGYLFETRLRLDVLRNVK